MAVAVGDNRSLQQQISGILAALPHEAAGACNGRVIAPALAKTPRKAPAELRRCDTDVACSTGLDKALRLNVGRVVTILEVDTQFDFMPVAGIYHELSVGYRECHRFFAEHMPARLGRLHCLPGM